MKLRKFTAFAVTLLLVAAPATPAFAVSKEIIQLQTQVQDLADRMAKMQQSFDERMGVMQSLVEHSSDNVNQLSQSVKAMQKTLQQQNSDSQAKVDQVSSQIQTLNDTLDELKARLAKASKQLDDIQGQQQNLPPSPSPSGSTTTGPASQAPQADILYNNALRDYNSGRYELALSQFQDYLKLYPNTELAGNAQYYVADMEYRAQNFEGAVRDYDKVLEQFPGGNKAAAAQLKKGYSLLELGRKEAGVRELNALIQRYPKTIEATQARERLQKLGASAARPAAAAKTH